MSWDIIQTPFWTSLYPGLQSILICLHGAISLFYHLIEKVFTSSVFRDSMIWTQDANITRYCRYRFPSSQVTKEGYGTETPVEFLYGYKLAQKSL